MPNTWHPLHVIPARPGRAAWHVTCSSRSVNDSEKNRLDLEMSEDRTRMSAQRTRDAADRTLMSWIRTALAMIAFGFSVFKLFQFLTEERPEVQHDLGATRVLTLSLIGLGTILLIVAIAQYRIELRELRKEYGVKRRFPLALWAAVIMALLGAYGVFSILLHMGGF
jgi:putative membrane protein